MLRNVRLLAALGLALALVPAPDAQAQEDNAQAWDLQSLVAFVSQDLNQFWTQVFDANGLDYRAPTGVFAYIETTRTTCGITDASNAFYCARSHSIHYQFDFLDGLLQGVGDFAVAAVIAHEWGHAVQGQLQIRVSRLSINRELQADCLAGAYAQYADAAGILEEGDLDEGVALMANIGDPEGTPRRARGAHGSSAQRVAAFQTGFDDGVNGCL